MLSLTDVLADVPTTTASALALFDSLPAVDPEFMIGSWHGAELPTGHPLDGMLAASGWWGKAFVDAETVHPLLFPSGDGTALWPLNPAMAFAGLGLAAKIPALKRQNFTGTIATLK
ncbi:MAG: GXWXG domain-containing protein, partial [Actinomycetia bacterium]|nr:GXWXG domain-containing protein [Actinomycetes bacterium]